MNYTTLLFDVDDTLLDFKKNEQVAFATLFQKLNLPLTTDIFARYQEINHKLWSEFEHGLISKDQVIHTRFRKLAEEFQLDYSNQPVEEWYQNELANGAFMMDGAYELCEKFSKTHRMYIVTNGIATTQYKRLKDSKLDQFFQQIFVSEEIGYQKPAKEFFDYVLEHIPDARKEDMLIIGDSLASDIKGGVLAGIDTCLIQRETKVVEGSIQPKFYIKMLEELEPIV